MSFRLHDLGARRIQQREGEYDEVAHNISNRIDVDDEVARHIN